MANAEELAVAETTKRFSWSEQLVPSIQTQDKVINSDGTIQIYRSKKRDKSSHVGNTQIQVKGVSHRSKFPDSVTHSTKLVDLRGYLREGGLIFVKGLVNQRTQDVKLYYMALTPFKILDFIKKAGDRQSTTLRLAELTTDPDELLAIVMHSHAARQEDPNNHGKPLNMREGYSLEIILPQPIPTDGPITLDRSTGDLDFVVYRTDEGGIRTMVDAAFRLIPPGYAKHSLGKSISSRTVSYIDGTVQQLDSDTIHIDLSNGLYMTVKRSHGQLHVSVTINTDGTVSDFLKDGQFYGECLEHQEIFIGEQRVTFNAATSSSEMLPLHGRISLLQTLFEKLHVDTRLVSMADLSAHVLSELETSRAGLLESQEIDPTMPTSGRFSLDIANQRIEILIELSEDSKRWIFHDPYSRDFRRQYYYLEDKVDGTQDARLVTPYDVLTPEDIVRTLNLNLTTSVEAYAKLPKAARAGELANQFVLNLLKASDASEVRREEFLDAAEGMLDWMESQTNGIDYILNVNKKQTKARRRQLEQEDFKELRRLRREMDRKSDSTSRQIALCCSVLLGDTEDALERLDDMSEDESNYVSGWPIMSLLHSEASDSTK